MKRIKECIRLAAVLVTVTAVAATSVGCQRVIEQDPVYSEYYEYIPIESEADPSDDSLSSEEDTSGEVTSGGDYGNDNYNDDLSDDDMNDSDYSSNTGTNGNNSQEGNNAVADSESYGKLEKGVMVYTVEEFGAVGDGKTDDGVAINDAVQEAQRYTAKNEGKKAVVRFSKGKTYVCKKQNFAGNSSGAVIAVMGVSNVTLEGNGATIIGLPNKSYLTIVGCSNVKVKGLNFTYDTPVAYRAKVTDREGSKVTFEVPEWYTKCIEIYDAPSSWFAIPANGRRDHSWIKSIEKVDATHCEVTFSSGGYTIMRTEWEMKTETNEICTSYVDIPTPGYSHSGTAFGIRGNGGTVELEDCNVWNASQFVFQVTGNSGNIKFTRTSLTTKDSKACPTVAWRDCIHAKDNRGPLTFTDCNFGGTHDDLFNISNTMLGVEEITKDGLQLYGYDYNGAFYSIYEGDTVVAFNPNTDKYYGEAKVEKLVRQSGGDIIIKLSKDIGIEKGAYLSFNEWAAPGTTITGGNFNGSVRIRASGTKITNANFSLIHMWTAYEGNDGSIEGPIPQNITYKNCSFKAANGATSGTRMTFNCKLIDGAKATSYAVKNIVFDGCKFDYYDIIDRSNLGVIIK